MIPPRDLMAELRASVDAAKQKRELTPPTKKCSSVRTLPNGLAVACGLPSYHRHAHSGNGYMWSDCYEGCGC